MPLNYSKWDALELSDDSDIEGHPNVDKKSLIRWQQRAIHEKREARKYKIAQLEAEIALNAVLKPRLESIHSSLLSPPPSSTSALSYYNQLIDQLRSNPSPDAPPTNAPNQPTYDQMVLSLLMQLGENEKVKGSDGDEQKGKAVADALQDHITELVKRTRECEQEVEEEKKEQKKHITSDDIHDGFDTHYQPPKPDPVSESSRTTKKEKQTEIEVLNPGSVAKAKAKETAEDDDGNELPELTPTLLEFSRLPLWGYEQSFGFIQANKEVVLSKNGSDALLVAGFRAEENGKPKYAKQCVHQSLLLQYCSKLGGDGIRMFFKKMISGDPRAKGVFEQDVEKTYAHLVERVKISEAEAAAGSAGRETIQLVPENPDQTITFNVPDGPPPEHLVLEGPGTEDMDINEVKKALQFRWEVYDAFPADLQNALKTGQLTEVNKVLGDMDVDEAEKVVEALNMAGIMSFAEGGVIDQTGKTEG